MLKEFKVIERVIKVMTMQATDEDVKQLRDWAVLSEANKETVCRYHHKELLDPSFDVAKGFDSVKSWEVLQQRISGDNALLNDKGLS